MKILFNSYIEFIEGKPVYGGPRIFAKLFIDHCRANKITCTGLVVKKDNTVPVNGIAKKFPKFNSILLRLDIKYRKFFRTRSQTIPPFLNKYIELICGQIVKEKPDVVLLFGFSLINWLILQAAKKAKVPVVTTHLGLWFQEIKDIASLTRQARKLTREMEKDMTRSSQAEIFLNNFSKKNYEKTLIKTVPAKTHIVELPYNPVYRKTVKTTRRKTAALNIGTIGRWDPIKDPEAFYSVAKKAREMNLPWKFHAVLEIGGRRKLLKLEKLFHKFVSVLDPMGPHQLKSFISKMDILLLPSRFDVSPNVVMEAVLQNRMTLISPAVGWVDEYRSCGAADWITGFSDTGRVIRKIKSLASKTTPPKKLYNYIKIRHSPEEVLKRYIRIIESLIVKA